MGPRTKHFLDVCILIRSLIVLASILIFTSDFLYSLGTAFVDAVGFDLTLDKNLLVIAVTVVVIYPLALMRSMNSLAVFSCFKLACLWLFAAVVVFLSVKNMATGKQLHYRWVMSAVAKQRCYQVQSRTLVFLYLVGSNPVQALYTCQPSWTKEVIKVCLLRGPLLFPCE